MTPIITSDKENIYFKIPFSKSIEEGAFPIDKFKAFNKSDNCWMCIEPNNCNCQNWMFTKNFGTIEIYNPNGIYELNNFNSKKFYDIIEGTWNCSEYETNSVAYIKKISHHKNGISFIAFFKNTKIRMGEVDFKSDEYDQLLKFVVGLGNNDNDMVYNEAHYHYHCDTNSITVDYCDGYLTIGSEIINHFKSIAKSMLTFDGQSNSYLTSELTTTNTIMFDSCIINTESIEKIFKEYHEYFAEKREKLHNIIYEK